MAFSFKVITGKAIAELMEGRVKDCIEVVRKAYLTHGAGQSVNPNSYFLRFPEKPSARIIALPAYLGSEFDVSGIKWIASYPENIKKGFPRASAVLLLNDYETGYPFACLESSIISASRTAASATLAASQIVPARKAQTLSVIGAGLISRYIVRFLLSAGWEFNSVVLNDLNSADAERFQNEVLPASLRGKTTVVATAEEAVRKGDLVLLATTAPTPHLTNPETFAHKPVVLHVSLRDISPEIILSSQNIVDDVGHVMTANTSVHLAEQKTGNRAFCSGTLAELVNGKFAIDRSRPVIFSPFGLGILDLAVGKWLYDLAVQEKRAVDIEDFFFELTR